MTKRGLYVFRCYGEKGKRGFSIDILARDKDAAERKARARYEEENIKFLHASLFCKYSSYCAGILDYIICII